MGSGEAQAGLSPPHLPVAELTPCTQQCLRQKGHPAGEGPASSLPSVG